MIKFDFDKEYQKTTESLVTIRFQDCDPLRHLNNAKYFDYYYNARDDQVPKLYGFKGSELYTEYQAIWVVYNHQIAYLKSAMMGEWVCIFSSIIWHNENTMVVEYYMTDERRKHLKNIMWTTLKFVSWEGKSVQHPEVVMRFLDKVSLKEFAYHPNGFQERLKHLKNWIKEGNLAAS